MCARVPLCSSSKIPSFVSPLAKNKRGQKTAAAIKSLGVLRLPVALLPLFPCVARRRRALAFHWKGTRNRCLAASFPVGGAAVVQNRKEGREREQAELLFKNGSKEKKNSFSCLTPQTPLATAEPSAAAGEGAAASAAAATSSSSPLLPPLPAPAPAFAAAAASAAAAAAPAGLVMSWIDALLRSLLAPPEARRIKYFWAWDATCVGVRVVTQLFFFFFLFVSKVSEEEKDEEKRSEETKKKTGLNNKLTLSR